MSLEKEINTDWKDRCLLAESLLDKIMSGQDINVLPAYQEWMQVKSGWVEVNNDEGE